MFQRLISRFPGRTRLSGQHQRLHGPTSVNFSDQSSKPHPQITQKRDLFSGTSKNFKGPSLLENPGTKFSSLKFASFIHSTSQNNFDARTDNRPFEPETNPGPFDGLNRPPINRGTNVAYYESLSRRLAESERKRAPIDSRPFGRDIGGNESGLRNPISMNFPRGVMRDNPTDRSGVEQNADIVHIKLMRNNTFVTVTDSKGNKKTGASAGCLAEMKGGPKVSKYSAEATAEHVGRVAKSMGLKSVVMKVNGFTFFKRKKLAILSFRDGYTHSRSDRNPIVYIEDTTRKPHNGCRLKKQRRV